MHIQKIIAKAQKDIKRLSKRAEYDYNIIKKEDGTYNVVDKKYNIISLTGLYRITYDFYNIAQDGGEFVIPFTVHTLFDKEIARSTARWMPEEDSSGVLLGFDDYFEDEWRKAIDTICNTYKAKATFFVNGALPTEFCYTALSKGHEIASHTINHKDVRTLSKSEFKYETQGAIHAFRSQNFAFSSFAYPFGFSEKWMHKDLLKYYNVVREFGNNFCVYSPKSLEGRGGIVSTKSIDNTKYASSASYEKQIKALLLMTKFLGDGSVCAINSHTIDHDNGWSITPERLDFLLRTAREMKLNFYIYKDFFNRKTFIRGRRVRPLSEAQFLYRVIRKIRKLLCRKYR
jgi:peptidoglycan/xylan/chitin deacetylase (PgdA/CDA1 family)